jgi:excisionase family DNA binding protein
MGTAHSVQGTEAYTVIEVGKMLGMSERTVWARIKDGTLPAIRIGKKTTRISRKVIERILEGNENGSAKLTG